MRSLSRPDKGSLFFLFYSNAGRNKIMNVGSCGPWFRVRIRWGKSSSSHNSPSPYVLDCKRVRIFAYSSTREQSNKRSRAPHTPYRRVRLAREAKLNYFEKKTTVLQSTLKAEINNKHLPIARYLRCGFIHYNHGILSVRFKIDHRSTPAREITVSCCKFINVNIVHSSTTSKSSREIIKSRFIRSPEQMMGNQKIWHR